MPTCMQSGIESPVTKEQLVKKYPSVFTDGVGLLEGEYHIRLDPQAEPDDLVQQEVLAPVTQPTAWVNSMVVVPKKDGKIRICLDPKDLNMALGEVSNKTKLL